MSARQIVTFRIDSRLMGIDIIKVREVNRVLEITPVQHAPNYVRGLINLRGQTVTVFDLGVRLGLEDRTIDDQSHNIVLQDDPVGLLVDGIGEVVQTEDDAIQPPPANVGGIAGDFIEGVVRLEEELLVVLSADKILKYEVINAMEP
ncbi:MAG: purine-binding chemotaxis protein CheW [Deltaproteobacteria bacterium]|nr:purine-binding chemotaxis protein CheW [Deltaproteobacteria bacterium]